MTLSVNEPSDQVLVSEIPAYIREDRVAINSISNSSDVSFTDLSVNAGTSQLSIPTNLDSSKLEVVKITGVGLVHLDRILGGTEGQVKLFVFQTDGIGFTDGLKSDGKFYLNSLPALSEYVSTAGDILALVNVGGNGSTINGYWQEMFRTLAVK